MYKLSAVFILFFPMRKLTLEMKQHAQVHAGNNWWRLDLKLSGTHFFLTSYMSAQHVKLIKYPFSYCRITKYHEDFPYQPARKFYFFLPHQTSPSNFVSACQLQSPILVLFLALWWPYQPLGQRKLCLLLMSSKARIDGVSSILNLFIFTGDFDVLIICLVNLSLLLLSS